MADGRITGARVALIGVLLAAGMAGIVSRLVVVQVVRREEYSLRSRKQSVQREVLTASRGRILDRKGRELAVSVSGGGKGAVAGARTKSRMYPHGDLAAALLGYVGRDGYGLGGAELAYDTQLRGEDGWKLVQRDARVVAGRQRRYNVDMPVKPPVTGADVYLSIDLDIQTILQTVLKQAMSRYRCKSAMGIVMVPSSGAVLAMAGEPSFDPNVAASYPLSVRSNLCISENFEPGSTFKLVAASAALQERLFTESDEISADNGVFTVYGEQIRDHEKFSTLTFAGALVHSSNVCLAKIADRLGSDEFYRYTRNYGFGQRTGITLPGEEAGILHKVSDWSGRTRVTMAMGQEVSATLLQVMSLYCAIANDGVLVQPAVLRRVVDSYGAVVDSATLRPVRRVVSADVSRRLRTVLTAVVDSGTGTRASIQGVAVAGKTGTSQKLDEETGRYSDARYYTSFVGMAPSQLPVLACGIVLNEPDSARAGGLSAAPVFRQVLQQIISHPDLEYASAILAQPPTRQQTPAAPATGTVVPMVCGLSVQEATQRLASLGFVYEVIGAADTVRFQAPADGQVLSAMNRVKLYADESMRTGSGVTARVAVPEVRGMELRDALNMLITRGITPYVRGAGVVREQRPLVGTLVREAQACSLFCSFGG